MDGAGKSPLPPGQLVVYLRALFGGQCSCLAKKKGGQKYKEPFNL